MDILSTKENVAYFLSRLLAMRARMIILGSLIDVEQPVASGVRYPGLGFTNTKRDDRRSYWSIFGLESLFVFVFGRSSGLLLPLPGRSIFTSTQPQHRTWLITQALYILTTLLFSLTGNRCSDICMVRKASGSLLAPALYILTTPTLYLLKPITSSNSLWTKNPEKIVRRSAT